MKKQLELAEAKEAAVSYLTHHGMPQEHAGMVADHLIYATLAGHDFAGLSRLQPIAEMLKERGPGGSISTLRETPISALLDGANVNGYVTSVLAMDKAIALAKRSGVGVVGVSNSWFSGMLRYYVERAADADLIGMHAANSTARVAPLGGIDRLLGTNPLAFAFPSLSTPLVIDFSSASMMWGDVLYHQQIGRPLPEGRAVDAQGAPTIDPAAALSGAILAWGGARGSALSMIVQALGILGGSDPVIRDGGGRWGYFFMAIDPELLMPLQDFKKNIQSLQDQVENSRPVPDGAFVRVPGSAATRKVREGRARGWIEVDEPIYSAITRHCV
ncbi:Ldh family oxidoreductase [Variovorax sp. LjRoot178]|uniref:Ldh family oxidoreductase n=1 Tax=Variovorax sp. LjRoot178 TaxID=3342277 RepID=UPI003ECD2C7F